jgi:hypothetical protein
MRLSKHEKATAKMNEDLLEMRPSIVYNRSAIDP